MNLLSVFFLTTLAVALPTPVINTFNVKPPKDDPFYQPPDNLSSYENGQIFRERPVSPDLQLKVTLAEVVQVAYKTEDVNGSASHSVATVFKPLIPSKEARLFSYQFWEDSAEIDCSPSYSMVKGITSPDWPTVALDTAIALQFALANGWYVVAADHEGPRSAFIEGYIQGQTGLDGIRAARSHLQLNNDVPTVLYGYSGGGSATVWMANLHESYAPDINIVGAAHGGTPVDVNATVNYLDRADRMFSGFIVGAFAGLLNAYPDKNETIWPHINKSLQDKLTQMDTPDNCILTEVLLDGHQEYHTQMDVDFYTFPPITELLHRESLLKNVSSGTLSVPKFPRYIFHAEGDEIIPYSAVNQFVNEQCEGGANIQWVPWKGDDHVSVEYLGIPDAFQFIIQAFDGTTPQVQCGTASHDILTLASTTVGDVIGQVVADMIEAVNGLTTPFGAIHFDPKQGYQS